MKARFSDIPFRFRSVVPMLLGTWLCLSHNIRAADEANSQPEKNVSPTFREKDDLAKQRALHDRMRGYATPKKALSDLLSVTTYLHHSNSNLTAKLRDHPTDTNLVEQVRLASEGVSLLVALKEEIAVRIYDAYALVNPLTEVKDKELRNALLSTTNELTSTEKTLFEILRKPEARQQRRELLSQNWDRLVQLSNDRAISQIRDVAPPDAPMSVRELFSRKNTEQEVTGEPIPAEFKLPKPD